MMKYIMAAESRRLYDRMSGDKLSEKQKEQMKSLMSDNMKDTELMTALWILSSILKEYYGKKVIILIDEYDVPLDKAFENNYYNEMIILLRNMLEQSLKTNDNLYMAVLTGCFLWQFLSSLLIHGRINRLLKNCQRKHLYRTK